MLIATYLGSLWACSHSGSLLPLNGMSWGYGWSLWPPAMNGCCEYIKYAVMDSRKDVVIQLGYWVKG